MENEVLQSEKEDLVNRLLDRLLFAPINEEKCVMILLLCYLADENSELSETAAGYLSRIFNESNITGFWQKLFPAPQSATQPALLYGILMLLASPCSERVKQEGREVLRRLLVLDSRRESESPMLLSPFCHSHCIPFFYVILDSRSVRSEFEKMINKVSGMEMDMELKPESIIGAINVLTPMMRDEEEVVSKAACRIMAYLVLRNEVQPLSLLIYIVLTSIPVIFEGPLEDDCIRHYLQNFTDALQRQEEEDEAIPMIEQPPSREEITACYLNYSGNKKLLVCAFLLKLTLLTTSSEFRSRINEIILAVVRADREGRTWVEGATIMERLLLTFQEQSRDVVKEAILDCILCLTSEEGTIVFRSVDKLLEELVQCFTTSSASEALQLRAGNCMTHFLNRDSYRIDLKVYLDVQLSLDLFNPPPGVIKDIAEECNAIVKDNINSCLADMGLGP